MNHFNKRQVDLGVVLRREGKYHEAVEVLREALKSLAVAYPNGHVDTVAPR